MIPGHEHFPAELDQQYTRLALAAAWPGELRPGYAVVVGVSRYGRVGGLPVLKVLDEASDGRLWELTGKLAALRMYYNPEELWADASNVAAMQFCSERRLAVRSSLLVEMDGPLAYALPVLKRLRDARRLVIPAGSSLTGELMTAPAHEGLESLKLADYPAIAALAFAVLAVESGRWDGPPPASQTWRPERIL